MEKGSVSHLYTWVGGPFLPSLAQRLMATNEYDGVPSEGGLFHVAFLDGQKGEDQSDQRAGHTERHTDTETRRHPAAPT